eukprot:SAG22_NODE_9017_length_614_cov_1.174757_1_plen_193_part_10
MAADCKSWSTEFTTPSPSDVTALGDNPQVITSCGEDDVCNFTYFQPDAQISTCSTNLGGKVWQPTCCDLPDENCTDLWLADAASRSLRTVSANTDKPWALFVGFHKPHPFWDVPQRFQDMYLETLPLPSHLDAPKDMPDVAYYSCTAIDSRSDVGGVNCNDTTLNPAGCSFVVPNASYASKVGLARPRTQLLR